MIECQLSVMVQEWVKISGTKKVNRYQPIEVRDALAALELAKERLQLAADQVSHPAPLSQLSLHAIGFACTPR